MCIACICTAVGVTYTLMRARLHAHIPTPSRWMRAVTASWSWTNATLGRIATAADRDCAVSFGRSLARTDLYHLLGHITARTLVVVGRESPEDDRFMARLVNSAIQHSYLRTLPGCAGGLLAADPDGTSEAALQLLNAWDLVGGQS